MKNINGEESIGIIGSSLTATDIAISIYKNNHKGKIFMFNRRDFPFIQKTNFDSYSAIEFSEKNISKVLSTNKYILRPTIKLFAQELRRLYEVYPQSLNDLLANTKSLNKIQSLMYESTELFEQIWISLNQHEKHFFFKNMFWLWSKLRVTVASTNCQMLREMIESKKLEIISGLANVEFKNQKFKFTMANSNIYTNVVFNATGPYRDYSNNPLIKNMLATGLLKTNIFGGVEIDTNSCETRNNKDMRNNNMYAVGHITCGAFLFTSAMKFINQKTSVIANDIIAKHNIEN